MSDYYQEYFFGFVSNIYDMLEKGYGYYNKDEFLQLVNQAKIENCALKEENRQLKAEIATMNANIVAIIERDLMHMRKKVNTIIKPNKYTRTIEELDI
jgi:cell division protein FtsB